MDLEGFEPSTSSVRLKRAPNCATGPFFRVEKILPVCRPLVKQLVEHMVDRQFGYQLYEQLSSRDAEFIIVVCHFMHQVDIHALHGTCVLYRETTGDIAIAQA